MINIFKKFQPYNEGISKKIFRNLSYNTKLGKFDKNNIQNQHPININPIKTNKNEIIITYTNYTHSKYT
jgi:hypothetical protein